MTKTGHYYSAASGHKAVIVEYDGYCSLSVRDIFGIYEIAEKRYKTFSGALKGLKAFAAKEHIEFDV